MENKILYLTPFKSHAVIVQQGLNSNDFYFIGVFVGNDKNDSVQINDISNWRLSKPYSEPTSLFKRLRYEYMVISTDEMKHCIFTYKEGKP